MSLGLSHQRTNNYVEDTRLEDQSTRITETQLRFNHGGRIGSGFVNSTSAGSRDRRPWRAGSRPPAGGRSACALRQVQPDPQLPAAFQLWGERFSFDSLATGQRSEDAVVRPTAHQPRRNSSVRGFKDQTLTGDSGGYGWQPVALAACGGMGPLRPWLQEYGVAFA
ncbi:ShlB/FhaC/HecB family hemolysin secretion/activation protein [Pseudomonas aeruginosa]|uniref:ShlB/FhaC/HecB family hemolysin secretion/activation protein n=1 Tax=Pseudomonas aeruginosa TaxID=287 RepID=UPI001EE7D627|nr:ShlB/FhaC/HecB family hemolysin secretion/activation protein [Pseudomonas aeruginosa]